MPGAHNRLVQGTTRPKHGQWPAVGTAALWQAVRAMNAAEPGLTAGGSGGLSPRAHGCC